MQLYRSFTHLTSFKIVALILATAVVLWSLGIPGWLHNASAAALTNLSDTLEDSDLSAASNHHIVFTTENGSTDNDSTITITFDGSFDLGVIGEDDIDVLDDNVHKTTAADCSGTEHIGISTTTNTITLQICSGDTGDIASSSVVEIKIGNSSVATSSGTGANRITNPSSAGSYAIDIAGTGDFQDSGQARVAIIDDVVVTAAVDTTLTFAISAVNASSTINSPTATTTGTTTATSIPFGTLTPGNTYRMAQDLAVSTNASNGFSVTVSANQTLTSGSGADINTFVDGDSTTTPIVWQSPAGTLGDDTTYGHWGVTSEDSDLNSDEYGTSLYAGNFVTNAREVFSHTGPADGSTADQGATRVGYQVEIDSLQEAGTDYQAVLTYVATPTF